MKTLILFTIYYGYVIFINGEDNKSGDTDLTVEAIEYLRRNGYYQPSDGNVASLNNAETIRKSIQSMQRFAGIPETGKLDLATKDLIKTPRCGLPDITKGMKTKRKRRWTLQGTKWSKFKLSWRLQNDNNDGLTREQVERTLFQAFSKWQAVTNMEFYKLHHTSKLEADIEVKFVTQYHNDPYPFDGKGGTLAHAFYPHTNEGLSGDVHFDDDEQFTLGKTGRNLLWVAVHEIGHSLGLEHSSVKNAIMYPWYKAFDGDDFDLNIDDIIGVQNLYGSKANPKPPTFPPFPEQKTTTTATKSNELIPGCTVQFKAIFLDKTSKKTYVINHDKVYVLDIKLKLEKGPHELRKIFPGLESIDAVYTRTDGRIVFFKDTKYYIYESVSNPRLREKGSIFDRYRGLLSSTKKIDAAFTWRRNGRTYLFTGKQYYRYDERYQYIDPNYPRLITSAWNGVPAYIDSVFEWSNDVTYFFKGYNYYRLNNQFVKVENNYPRSIGAIWTKCSGKLIGNKNAAYLPASNVAIILITSFLTFFSTYC